jgi:prepilin-type N-terminal cleavage/methylation domain-containing protein
MGPRPAFAPCALRRGKPVFLPWAGAKAGYTLIELMFVVAVAAVVIATVVPQLLVSIDRSRGFIAAKYLGGRLARARMLAVTSRASVGLRFTQDPGGISFEVFKDGNRNGILTTDIAKQIDRPIEPPTRLFELFPGAEIGLVPGTPAPNALQLGGSDILSFSPAGTATSGTVYVRGRDGTQWAVRVLGATGRTRVQRYVPATKQWIHAF